MKYHKISQLLQNEKVATIQNDIGKKDYDLTSYFQYCKQLWDRSVKARP